MNNFLVAKLGNNDFGHLIRDAIKQGIDYWGLDNTIEPSIWKDFILNHIENYYKQSNLIYNYQGRDGDKKSTIEYLRRRMNVTYENQPPSDDDDGGSAAYAFDTKYLFTF